MSDTAPFARPLPLLPCSYPDFHTGRDFLQLTSNFIFALDFARMPIRSATVSEFGSSMVRVSFEEEGESLLASLIASAFDDVSTTVLGVVVSVVMDSP